MKKKNWSEVVLNNCLIIQRDDVKSGIHSWLSTKFHANGEKALNPEFSDHLWPWESELNLPGLSLLKRKELLKP